jgi:WD40 repeat protein
MRFKASILVTILSICLIFTLRLQAQETRETLVYVRDIDWSPDSRYLAVTENNSVHLRETASDSIVYTFESHDSSVHFVAWSPTGDAIASGDANGTIHVWEPFTGEVIVTLTGHTSIVESLDWNPSGRMLASGSDDATLRVWDVEEENEITSVAFSGAVMAVDWSPDGDKIAYGGIDASNVGGAYEVIEAPVLVGLRAHAGADQTVLSSDGAPVRVKLDGSWSQSTVGDIGSYAWRENGEVIATGINPELTLDPGTHTIELTIFNDYIRSDTDEVVIRVLEEAATAAEMDEAK